MSPARGSEPPRLRNVAVPYVTLAAARTYAAHERCGVEAARRQLTEYILAARPVDRGQCPELWRFRSRDAGLDITLRVAVEGPLAVVVSVAVREDSRVSSRP